MNKTLVKCPQSKLPNSELFFGWLEILFIPQDKGSDEIEKHNAAKGDKRQIDEGQSDMCRFEAHLVSKPGAYTKRFSLVLTQYFIKGLFHLA